MTRIRSEIRNAQVQLQRLDNMPEEYRDQYHQARVANLTGQVAALRLVLATTPDWVPLAPLEHVDPCESCGKVRSDIVAVTDPRTELDEQPARRPNWCGDCYRIVSELVAD